MSQSLKQALPSDVLWMQRLSVLLVWAAALIALAGVVGWALQHPYFAIKGISVRGDVMHTNALTLRSNVAPQLAGGYFTLDLQQARAAFEAVPWVRQALVQREFPNRLRVTLQEHQAVALWRANDNSDVDSRMVNSFGQVFEANVGEVDDAQLPRLFGPPGSSAIALQMHQSLQPLLNNMGWTIRQLTLSPWGSWRATLDNEAVLELGSGSASMVLARVQRFMHTLTHVAAAQRRSADAILSADLRYEHGYALRLQGITTTPAAHASQPLNR